MCYDAPDARTRAARRTSQMATPDPNLNYTDAALRIGARDPFPDRPTAELMSVVAVNEPVAGEYWRIAVDVHERAMDSRAGQFFHLLCPSPDGAEVWMRRPMSIYRVDRGAGRLEFLYKTEGRGTHGISRLRPGDEFNITGPLGVGFRIDPEWGDIVALGRGVGLATLAPLSQLAAESGVGVTAILSARSADVLMSGHLFSDLGADVVTVLDTDRTSDVGNVEGILRGLVAGGRADAFFTCGSNRLLKLMQRLGREHGIPGQVAMEQIMVCGLGACYVCVRTFEVDGQRILRRVCREGPVFDLQEAVGW